MEPYSHYTNAHPCTPDKINHAVGSMWRLIMSSLNRQEAGGDQADRDTENTDTFSRLLLTHDRRRNSIFVWKYYI